MSLGSSLIYSVPGKNFRGSFYSGCPCISAYLISPLLSALSGRNLIKPRLLWISLPLYFLIKVRYNADTGLVMRAESIILVASLLNISIQTHRLASVGRDSPTSRSFDLETVATPSSELHLPAFQNGWYPYYSEPFLSMLFEVSRCLPFGISRSASFAPHPPAFWT